MFRKQINENIASQTYGAYKRVLEDGYQFISIIIIHIIAVTSKCIGLYQKEV